MIEADAAFLEHHGVKGMKWGVRRDNIASAVSTGRAKVKQEIADRKSTDVIVRTKPGAGVRTVGGNQRNAHEDAITARSAEQVAKRSTLDALSNKDLQNLVTRMNLEQQYRNLAVNEVRLSAGEKYLNDLLVKHGDKATNKLGDFAPLGKMVLDAASPNSRNKGLQGGKVTNKKNK